MLKINPVITEKSVLKSGVPARTSGFYASAPILKPLEKDVFEFSNRSYTLSFGANKINKYKQGEEIAKGLYDVLEDSFKPLSKEKFKTEFEKINEKNIIPTLKAYDKLSPKRSLISAISKASLHSKQTRMDSIDQLTGMLVNLGEKAGVQVDHYKKSFDEEMKGQFDSIFPVKAGHMNKISRGLAQAIENKNSVTAEDRKALKKASPEDIHSFVIDSLYNSAKNADNAMEEQANYDGWSAKLGEAIRSLWKSNNQKELVHKDIALYREQIAELEKTKGSKQFEVKFKELFDVDFDPELVAKFKEKEENFIFASVCSTIENNFKTANSELLSNKPLMDKYYMSPMFATGSMPVKIASRQEVYDKNLNAFAEFIGKGDIENGKKQIEQAFKERKVKEDSPIEEKFATLQKMANRYAKRLHQNTQRALGKKDLEDLKQEYDSSFYAAFGVKNDIAKRVTDYRNAQSASDLLIQDAILGAVSIPAWMMTAGSGLIPTLKLIGIHSGAAATVYGSDRLVSKNGISEKELTELLRRSMIDGATVIANQLSYKGIEAITSTVSKMSGKAAKITDIVLSTAADVGIDCGMEYVATGRVSFHGVQYSIIFSSLGQILDLKLDMDEKHRKVL